MKRRPPLITTLEHPSLITSVEKAQPRRKTSMSSITSVETRHFRPQMRASLITAVEASISESHSSLRDLAR